MPKTHCFRLPSVTSAFSAMATRNRSHRESQLNTALWTTGRGARLDRTRLVLRSVAEPATASWTEALVGPRCRIHVRMRFVSLGSADASTGDKAIFRIRLSGDQIPDATLGFLYDRYNPEPAYKVVRTDDQWHDWTFDLDMQSGTIQSHRDRTPIALHAFPNRSYVRLAVEATGSADLPAHVEIERLSVDAFPAERKPARTRPRKPVDTGSMEWLSWRRDPGLTAVVPGVGDLTKSRLVDRIAVPAGASPQTTWLDLDGDGEPEMLIAGNGRLDAFRKDGTRLWSRRLEAPVLWGMHDIDGDGNPELLLAAGTPSRLHVCDPISGTSRFISPFRDRYGIAGIKVGKLIPDSRGLQVVAWGHLDDTGVVLRFDDGAAQGRLAWTFHWKETFFTPLVALADMRRSGNLDLVVVTYNNAFVFDGRDGTPRMHHAWSSGRNYGSLVVTDIDNDGYPDVVVLADVLREHVAVLRNDAGRGLRVLWDSFVEQNYPDDHASLRVATEAVADFDGDGRVEIAWSLFDDRVDNHWRTLLVDAITGKRKQVLLDRWMAGAVAGEGNSTPRLILSKPQSRDAVRDHLLFVRNLRTGNEVALPPGKLVPGSTMADHPVNAWSQVSGIATGLPTRCVSRGTDGQTVVLASPDSREVLTVSLPTDRPFRVQRIGLPQGTTVRHVDPSRRSWAGIAATGQVAWFAGSGAVRSLQASSGSIVQPVVGKLDPNSPPCLVFVDPAHNVHCVDGVSGRERWSVPGRGMHSFYIPQSRPGGIPLLADIDQDGHREVIISRGNRLCAIAADGTVRRTWKFPGPPMLWTTGDFLGDGACDLAVAWERGAVLDMETCVVSGKTGKVVWRMQGGNGPLAIGDVDGDGRDDVVTRDLYERRTWSGRSGRDLLPVDMLAGYHTPIVAPGSFAGIWWVGGSWATSHDDARGRPAWSKPLSPTGTGCLADVDGDGRLELAGVTFGNLYALPVLQPVSGPDRELLCWDAVTGEQRWSFSLTASTGGIVAADVDRDGLPEFVFGMADGRVVAVGARGQLRWERSLPSAAGVPVIADLDGDGKAECIVPCGDGHIYVFGEGRR